MGLDEQKFRRHIAGLRYSNQVSVGQGKTTAWPEVNLLVPSIQMLRLLRINKTRDIRLFAHLEDIHMLKALFMNCSFSLAGNQCNGLGRRISMYATTLVQDEEYLSPQCRMTQL